MTRLALLSLALTVTALAQTTPENLVVEGVPPIAEELRRDAGRYLEFRAASFQSWHPQRHEMLIRTRFAETSQMHLVKMPGGDRRQMTFLPEPVAGGSFQPKTGDCFVFAQDTGGGEFFQLYRYDLADGKIALLTDGKSRNTGARWARSGKQLAYASTRRNGKDNDIRAMNPDDPKSDREVKQLAGGGWAVLDWSHDEQRLLIGEYVSANESYLHVLDLKTGALDALTPRDGAKVVHAGGRFAADDASVFTATDRDAEFQRLAQIEVKTKALRVLTPQLAWDVEEFELSPDGATLAFLANEEGASVLRLLEVRTGAIKAVPAIPSGVLSGIEWHEDGKALGFSLNSAKSPTDAYALEVASGRLTRWTESETGGIDPKAFVEPEIVRVKSFDGLTMSGFLYRPDSKKFPGPRACIIDIHGGPEGQSQPTFQGRWNYYLNEMGVAIFYPNVRGSSGYGKTFLTLDNGMKREDSVRDIGAFLDALGGDAGLDRARFAVLGGSYGGYMTLACLIHHGDRLRCGIDVVGISNFLTFLKNTQDYRRDLRRVEYGDEREPGMSEFLAKISPTTRAAEIRKPLFVVQGKNDPRVPVTEAEQMVKAVRAAGGTAWYLMATDEGHGFAKKKNADFLFLATIEFLRAHLLKN